MSGKTENIKMAVLKRDTTFNELFITPIRGLYADCAITIDEFKERNSALLKDKWVDTRHGENGQNIYQLFDPTVLRKDNLSI